jgi:hypothetical protein
MVSTVAGTMDLRFYHPSYSALTKSDDYSYSTTATTLTDNPHITAYIRGTLAWGMEP